MLCKRVRLQGLVLPIQYMALGLRGARGSASHGPVLTVAIM